MAPRIPETEMKKLSTRETKRDSNSWNGAKRHLRTSVLLPLEGLEIFILNSGIVHQVNLESIARVVFETNGYLYPDSVVGTDSHTTMINGLGVLGWGVGGIEAEANMLGETTSMVLPQVVGFKLTG